MFAFFQQRPGLAALSIVSLSIGGALLAQRSSSQTTRLSQAPPSLAIAGQKGPHPAEAWRSALDLDHARVDRDGRQLIQSLADGTRVVYTIDPALQAQAKSLLERYEVPYGAIVMYELASGEVLVMAGRSAMDPEVDAERLCLTPWAPAASVFKLVTASALLDRGVGAETSVCYHGGLRGLDAETLADNPRRDNRCNTLTQAIAKSVNPVIGKLALRHLDRDAMLQAAERYGFNTRIPFELTVQPSRAEIPHDDLERARTAAGFWHTEISALHGAVIAGVAAGKGMLHWPHVVRRVQRAGNLVSEPKRAAPLRAVDEQTAVQLRRAMVLATKSGSARRGFYTRRGRPFLPGTEVGGKTGSLTRSKPRLDYSWFVGFAPAPRPEVAFAVILANPPRWRIKASTAARLMIEQFNRTRRERAVEARNRSEQRGSEASVAGRSM